MTELLVPFIGDQQPQAKRQCCDLARPVKPSALKVAASVASKDPDRYIAPKRKKMPLYSHWFATDMYDNFKLMDTVDSSNMSNMSVNGQMYSLPMDTLTKCATIFKTIVIFCTETTTNTGSFLSAKVRGHEDTFSSLLTPVFHNLFGTIVNVVFLGQPVIRIRNDDRRQVDKPDHIIAVKVGGIPINCVAVCDSKINDAEKGKDQVHAYGLAIESKNVFLGITITRTKIFLQLFMPFDNKLSVIDICDACCDNLNELKTFLGTLYAAVQALVECPIAAPSHPFTLKCCGQEVPCLARTEHINLSTSTCSNGSFVLHCTTTKKVRKYYDMIFHHIPSEDVSLNL